MSDYKKQTLETIREAGYAAYMRDQEKDTWCYFTDGTRIGSAEFGRDGLKVYTAHKPNPKTGTGFPVREPHDWEPITPAQLALAFMTAPSWATVQKRASVVKFKDWAEFKARDSFNAEYKPVNYEELS